MTAPLRILHVFRAPVGGLFRHVVDLVRGQAARGHAVGIVCDSRTGGERAAETLERLLPDLALGLARLPMERRLNAGDLLAVARLSDLAATCRPDVVHGHGSKGGAYARLAALGGGRPRPAVRAYTPHGGSFNYQPGSLAHRAYMRAEAILARRTHAFLFESAFVKGRFVSAIGNPSAPAPVVRNGLDPSEFAPVRHAPDARDLLFIGEWRLAKGLDTLLDALALLRRERGRSLSLQIIGSGPDEELLRRIAGESGIADLVAFGPPRPIRDALGSARVMVVPSKAESLPYVVLEAAAAAQPLVATNVGGIPEIFGPQADALVPACDPSRLADAILATVDADPATRRETALRLQRHVRGGFRMDRMVEGVLDGYAHGLRHAERPRLARPHGPALSVP